MSTSLNFPFAAMATTGYFEAHPMSKSPLEIDRTMLCKPVSYAAVQQHPVCKRYFQSNQFTVAVRLLCLGTDLPVIYNWLPWRFTRFMKKDAHIRHLNETYTCIADSSSVQSFFVQINEVATAQVDIHHAMQDDVSSYYEAKPGDYRIQLLIDPEKESNHEWSLGILQTCQDFFFSFAEVERLVVVLDEESNIGCTLEKAGFTLESQIIMPGKKARMFRCGRKIVA
ncbi:acetyltransferase [Pseudoflavitalea sp. G-6-1-2]|uniref:GNAT family N-acetyltransferase n=1 Tax=Pseudoflavitalea sp. G-6-1-2 TaxID=2728841 RepID=UPI00146C3BD2|nr:GNAT family N-acetyltransferase [Pseudoflavitalea sp. G-6-1-2]NML19373.1 acetyltransferase [Pseudoflavitalea sp. G-6-1-2]